MFCKKCGEKLGEKDLFCMKCGNRIKKEKIGGWLLVIVLYLIIGGIIGVATTLLTANGIGIIAAETSGNAFDELVVTATAVTIINMIFCLNQIYCGNKLIKKKDEFFQFYHVYSFIFVILYSLISYGLNVHLERIEDDWYTPTIVYKFYKELSISYKVGTIRNSIEIVVLTLYFCNSKRVYHYMQGNTYIKKNIFVRRFVLEKKDYSYTNVKPIEKSKVEQKTEKLEEINTINMLKEYKNLLDSGIITEEEFEKKKNELL